jgi:thioredoxin-like negative regulator of GroEL
MKIPKLSLINFKKAVDSGIPFVVKFKSDACYICTELEDTYKEVATEFPKVKFYNVDVDDEEDLANIFVDDGVPTIYYVKGKKVTELEYPDKGFDRDSLVSEIKKAVGE